jgi:hypothetical protein
MRLQDYLRLALQEEDMSDEEVGIAAALVEPEAVGGLALRHLHVAAKVGATGELHLGFQKPGAELCEELQGPDG